MRLPMLLGCTRFLGCTLVLTVSLLAQTPRPAAPLTSAQERAVLHSGPDWETIAPHLPDPATATAAQLELTGDVLRARRFPEDALDYYGYAMARGGNISELFNKMGIVRLELRQNDLARAMFQRTVHVQNKNAGAWNNLGVTEYADQNYRAAISDYKRAAKIDKKSGVYHSNLGMAYFELQDMESARREFAVALRLEPALMRDRDSGGTTAHVLGTQHYGHFCFEMGRLFAGQQRHAEAIQWLAKAAEAGYAVRAEMKTDPVLAPLLKNPEMQLLLTNSENLHGGKVIAKEAAPSLGVGPDGKTPETKKL